MDTAAAPGAAELIKLWSDIKSEFGSFTPEQQQDIRNAAAWIAPVLKAKAGDAIDRVAATAAPWGPLAAPFLKGAFGRWVDDEVGSLPTKGPS